MMISRAPQLLRKAATAFRGKTGALRTKLLVLASLRRRVAVACAVSRRIHALVSAPDQEEKHAAVEPCGGGALVLSKGMEYSAAAVTESKKEPALNGRGRAGLSAMAMFDDDDAGHDYPADSWSWTHHVLFDDDHCCNVVDVEEEEDDEDSVVVDALDEPSVIEIIRSNRQVEGLEFNLEDDIDEACDMFIRRVRSRMIMNRGF